MYLTLCPTLLKYFEFLPFSDPECIPCKSTDQVLNEDGEYLKCDEQSNSSLTSSRPDRPRPSRPSPGSSLIGGSLSCPKGKVLDARGNCKFAYKFSIPNDYRKRRRGPTNIRNLRKYLRRGGSGCIAGCGFDICDEGQVKDTRGVCKTAYTISRPKKEKDVEPREITSPKPKINLREYLQRLYSF